jgi:hypothetical protein
MTRQPNVCPRLKKSGKPCTAHRVRAPDEDPEGWESPACAAHMVLAEFDELAAARERATHAIEARFSAVRAQCWDWPVTDQHRELARAATECTDLERAENLATELLVDWQDDRCAICGGHRQSLVTDHDHGTWLVRGLLCGRCNIREGFADPSEVFGRYRAVNPATMLGIRIRYWDPFRGYAKPQTCPPAL